MGCEAVCEDGRLIISVSGRCSYEVWTEPKKLIMTGDQPITECEIDFSEASFLDSSGIGSLLALREILGMDVKIVLLNTNALVMEVLKVANVDRMFEIP
jgi:anti-anti-sigma factor